MIRSVLNHIIGPIIATTASLGERMNIDTVLLKVASRCNINCEYCYVYNMGDTSWRQLPKRISKKTIVEAASALAMLRKQQNSGFAVVLHGGEPLLIGRELLETTLSNLRQALPSDCSLNIQTNGMLLTNPILDLCERYNASLSISIDGPSIVHDNFRVGHSGQKTHRKVEKSIEMLRTHRSAKNIFSGLLAVIDPKSDPCEIYAYFKSLRTPSIDFLPRDGNHSRLPYGKSAPNSIECGKWLCSLLDVYLADRDPPRIRILDDLIKLVIGGRGEKEGMGLTDYGILTIDTDGSVTKNDTLKSTRDRADKFSHRWFVGDSPLSEIVASREYLEYHGLQRPSSSICQACPELKICGGGMPLHRWHDESEFDNPSIYCSDQKFLISHIRQQLKKYQNVA